LEGKDPAPGARMSRSGSPLRHQSVQFQIVKESIKGDVMIDPSMLLLQDNLAIPNPLRSSSSSFRRQSNVHSVTEGFSSKQQQYGSPTAGGTGGGMISSTTSAASHSITKDKEREQFPSGAQVPAIYFKEIEEQLADALYKRTQAKLMADPDKINVESALADALRVNSANLLFVLMFSYACVVVVVVGVV
jgi:hypothetical protein